MPPVSVLTVGKEPMAGLQRRTPPGRREGPGVEAASEPGLGKGTVLTWEMTGREERLPEVLPGSPSQRTRAPWSLGGWVEGTWSQAFSREGAPTTHPSQGSGVHSQAQAAPCPWRRRREPILPSALPRSCSRATGSSGCVQRERAPWEAAADSPNPAASPWGVALNPLTWPLLFPSQEPEEFPDRKSVV